jgi:filamentous hemagglutinin family protein
MSSALPKLITTHNHPPPIPETLLIPDKRHAHAPALIRSETAGVLVVNINPPDARGVSHNQYTHFQIGLEGLILNNQPLSNPGFCSHLPSTFSQLPFILPNPALQEKPARIILNEITHPTAVQLHGTLQVIGSNATVIIANPQRISRNLQLVAGHFINISRLILTTGQPLWDLQGQLIGYGLKQGTIQIDQPGSPTMPPSLHVGQQTQLDLVARSVVINAPLYGKQIRVITGIHVISHTQPLKPGSFFGSPNKPPEFAIEISAQGSLQAHTTQLIARENGIGVKVEGNIQTQHLTLTNQGPLMLHGQITGSEIHLHSQAHFIHTGSLVGDRLQLKTKEFYNAPRGFIDSQYAKVRATQLINQGHLSSNRLHIIAKTLQNKADDQALSGCIAARQQIHLQTHYLTNHPHSKILSQGDITITGFTGLKEATVKIDNLSAHIQANRDLHIHSYNLNNQDIKFKTELLETHREQKKEYKNIDADSRNFTLNPTKVDSWFFHLLYNTIKISQSSLDRSSEPPIHWVFWGHQNDCYYDYQRIIQESHIQQSYPAYIRAGRDLQLSGQVLNDKSDLTAGACLSTLPNAPALQLNNQGAEGQRIVTDNGTLTIREGELKTTFFDIPHFGFYSETTAPYAPPPTITYFPLERPAATPLNIETLLGRCSHKRLIFPVD